MGSGGADCHEITSPQRDSRRDMSNLQTESSDRESCVLLKASSFTNSTSVVAKTWEPFLLKLTSFDVFVCLCTSCKLSFHSSTQSLDLQTSSPNA